MLESIANWKLQAVIIQYDTVLSVLSKLQPGHVGGSYGCCWKKSAEVALASPKDIVANKGILCLAKETLSVFSKQRQDQH